MSHFWLIGMYIYVPCVRNPSTDKSLTALCQTLSSQSQTGTRWEYVTFTQGAGKHTKYYKCVVVSSTPMGGAMPMGGMPMAQQGQAQAMMVAVPPNGVAGTLLQIQTPSGQQMQVAV
jgi:hypothetical protein